MRITVCELPDEQARRDAAWTELARYLADQPPDVLMLPEMPFVDWAVFMSREVDPDTWRQVLDDHDAMILRFTELRADVVLSSRPVETDGQRFNQGFAWTSDAGYQGGRSKVYLPDEPDGREAAWLDRGDLDPSTFGSAFSFGVV